MYKRRKSGIVKRVVRPSRGIREILRFVYSIHRVRNSHKFDALRQWDFHPIAAAGSIIEG